MFEFAVHGPLRIRLRVGRWHFRTWRSFVMRLPKGYRAPEPIYEVIGYDSAGSMYQLAAFFDEEVAEALMAQLEAEGRTGLAINHVFVHSRVVDWEFDR